MAYDQKTYCAEDDWQNVLNKTFADLGSLDVLVNNAGIVHTGFANDVPTQKHNATVVTNFFGPMKGW